MRCEGGVEVVLTALWLCSLNRSAARAGHDRWWHGGVSKGSRAEGRDDMGRLDGGSAKPMAAASSPCSAQAMDTPVLRVYRNDERNQGSFRWLDDVKQQQYY